MVASWAEMVQADGVFIQRPHDPSHVDLVKLARRHGRMVWADYDDLIWQMPPWMPQALLSSYNAARIKCIELVLREADFVTTTTPYLAEQMSRVLERNDIRVVPNALPSWCSTAQPDDKRENMILWRGSDSHKGDLEPVVDDIVELSHDLGPGWGWKFVGHKPDYLLPKMCGGSWTYEQWHEMSDYWRYMRSLSPRVVIVPLTEHPFNRAKSNIAWIEATALGAVTVAPDWPEWQRPGVVTYGRDRTFQEAVREATTQTLSPELDPLPKMNHSNALRMEIIDAMAAGSASAVYP